METFKKNVMIIVDSKQEHPDKEPDTMNFITEGVFYKKDNRYCITYIESPVTGLDGTTTTLEVDKDSITLIRFGKVSSLMVFEKGRKYTTEYNTEHGIIEVGVTAHKVNIDMNDNGGRFDIEYILEINNRVTSFTALNVKVQ